MIGCMNMFFYLALLTKEKNQVKRKHKKKKQRGSAKNQHMFFSRSVNKEGNENSSGQHTPEQHLKNC